MVLKKVPQPFFYPGENEKVGILLIHGFTGSTAELVPMGKFLNQQGYTVHAPLLKGHGKTPEEMQLTRWPDWLGSALEGYQRLKKAGYEHIITVGLSMGGLLAVKVAQHAPVMGMVTLCAPIKVRDKRLGLARYVQHFLPYKQRTGAKVEHIEREVFIYDKTPLSCIVSFEKLLHNTYSILPYRTEPILVIQAQRDETVDPCSGQLLYERIGSSHKELIYYHDSYHIITLDKEKEEVFKKVTCFIQNLERMVENELEKEVK